MKYDLNVHFFYTNGLRILKKLPGNCQNFQKATQRPTRDVLRIGSIMLQKTAPPMNTVVKTNNMYETGPLLGLSQDVCLKFQMKSHLKTSFQDIYIILPIL